MDQIEKEEEKKKQFKHTDLVYVEIEAKTLSCFKRFKAYYMDKIRNPAFMPILDKGHSILA